MSIVLLDELLFWMRCRQLRFQVREAAERLIMVLKALNYTERSTRIWLKRMNKQIRKNNSTATREK